MARNGLSDIDGIFNSNTIVLKQLIMWPDFNKCLDTNSTIIIVFVYHWNLGEAG